MTGPRPTSRRSAGDGSAKRTPGSGSLPYIVRPILNVPAGVVPSPSRRFAETPFFPRRAAYGPATGASSRRRAATFAASRGSFASWRPRPSRAASRSRACQSRWRDWRGRRLRRRRGRRAGRAPTQGTLDRCGLALVTPWPPRSDLVAVSNCCRAAVRGDDRACPMGRPAPLVSHGLPGPARRAANDSRLLLGLPR